MSIKKCIGVRFRKVGKIYFFCNKDEVFNIGDHVIVETVRGLEYGRVEKLNINVDEDVLKIQIKDIIRKATEEDAKIYLDNKNREKDAYVKCLQKIKEHNLPMKLLDCEYTFDSTKILFYFFSDNRIDFRELVKDLATIFRIRIELRQIGVRDAAKVIGGIGPCGRPTCCSTYITEFKLVSVKMAKEQGMSLNPSKLSGTCGRLMCCLNHEEDIYSELNLHMPDIGSEVKTIDGFRGTVYSINTLKQTAKIVIDVNNEEKEIREYKSKDLRFKKKIKKYDIDDIEIKKLEDFEKDDVRADL